MEKKTSIRKGKRKENTKMPEIIPTHKGEKQAPPPPEEGTRIVPAQMRGTQKDHFHPRLDLPVLRGGGETGNKEGKRLKKKGGDLRVSKRLAIGGEKSEQDGKKARRKEVIS